jgi:hypothetical protein
MLRTPQRDQIPVDIIQKKNRSSSGLVGSSANFPNASAAHELRIPPARGGR